MISPVLLCRCRRFVGHSFLSFGSQRPRTVVVFAVVVSSVFSTFAHAQSFKELEAELRSHPRLLAMSYQAESDKAIAQSSMGLPDPEVSLGINNFPIFDPSFDEFLPSNKALGIKQRFPSRSARKARSSISDANAILTVAKRDQLFAAMRGELVAQLHKQKKIRLQQRFAQQRNSKYAQLIDVVESEVDGGRLSIFRQAEIEAQRAELFRIIANLTAQATQVESQLVYLLGRVPNTSPPDIKLREWSGELSELNTTSVAQAVLMVSDGGVAQAKSAWQSEWGAQVTYQQREAGRSFDGDDWVSAMVTFTIPIWSKSKQLPQLKAAQAVQHSAKYQLQEAQRRATAQYAGFKASYVAANKNKVSLEQKATAVKEEIDAQKRSYESGAGYYGEIIEGEIILLKLRSEIAIEVANIQIYAAKMNALLVTP